MVTVQIQHSHIKPGLKDIDYQHTYCLNVDMLAVSRGGSVGHYQRNVRNQHGHHSPQSVRS